MKNRIITKVVKIGDVVIGGGNPIVIQSMTTTDTMDTEATVGEIVELYHAGCDLVRVTAPNISSAKNLKNIKELLLKKNIKIPLVADIHFTPDAAIEAAKIVDKVRINPGNYSDTKRFKVVEYTEEEYQKELIRIKEKFIPLIAVCKEYNTAMRIGTNHGSLSDRIMNYYGDTPKGMVMSALEFLDICEEQGFYDIVFSMKASNPLVMIEAYELLVEEMTKRGALYPLHLGVTEAGSDEQGRIKSALGIGALLAQGIGDTIRVSLTEDPVFEIPVAKSIVEYFTKAGDSNYLGKDLFRDIYAQTELSSFSEKMIPVVMTDLSKQKKLSEKVFDKINHHFINGKWMKQDISSDYFLLNKNQLSINRPQNIPVVINYKDWEETSDNIYPLFDDKSFFSSSLKSKRLNFLFIDSVDIIDEKLQKELKLYPFVLLIKSKSCFNIHSLNKIIFALHKLNINNPIVLYPDISNNSSVSHTQDHSLYQIYLSCELSIALSKNLIQGVCTELNNEIEMQTVFDAYQASRKRISKTEFISCPSCGRTYFDLQTVTQKIKKYTSHLKNVRIGIMGCIVNGPGEMADADFGYVGAGKGKITLYKGKDVVSRNIPSEIALEKLIDLIKESGMWADPVDL